MRKLVAGMIAVAGLVAVTQPAMAQGGIPLAVEGHIGAAHPTDSPSEGGDFFSATGFGADVVVQVVPLVNVYGGWDRYSVSDGNTVDSGARLGAQLSIPVDLATGFSPFVSAGLLYNRTSSKVTDGRSVLTFTSDWKVGYELGAGLAVPVLPRFSILPAVRYRTHDVVYGDVEDALNWSLPYLSAEVGLKLGL